MIQKRAVKKETCQDFDGDLDSSFCATLWYKL